MPIRRVLPMTHNARTPNAALCQPAEPDVERKTNTEL